MIVIVSISIPLIFLKVLVHGDVYEMDKLKKALEADYRENEKNLPIYTPGNGTKVVLEFKGEKVAKVRIFSFFLPLAHVEDCGNNVNLIR